MDTLQFGINKRFNEVFNNIEKKVELNIPNSCINLDDAFIQWSKCFTISIGDIVKTTHRKIIQIGTHQTVEDLRIIIIGTRLGNVFVYELCDKPHTQINFVCSKELDYILGFNELSLTYEEFNRLFGPREHIGQWLENVTRILEQAI